MAKIVFLHVPTSIGHFQPTIPLMKNLSSKHIVFCVADRKQLSALKDTPVIPIEHGVIPAIKKRIDYDKQPKQVVDYLSLLDQRAWLSLQHFHNLRDAFVSINPDVVIFDEWMAICAFMLSQVCSSTTKWIQSNTKMFLPDQYKLTKTAIYSSCLGLYVGKDHTKLETLINIVSFAMFQAYREYDIPQELLMYKPETKDGLFPDLFFMQTSKFIHPKMPALERRIVFLGAPQTTWDYFAKVKQEEHQIEKTPMIYVSLGTVDNNNVSFFKRIIQIAKNHQRCQYIISCGHRICLKEQYPLPQNVTLKPFVNQLEVLEKASLFISHGGMNSFTEAICSRTPMLLVPQEGDQFLVTNMAMELGIGKFINENNVDVATINSGVSRSQNDGFIDRVTQIRNTLEPLDLDVLERIIFEDIDR